MSIRPIIELALHLSKLPCHEIRIENNVIKAKSLIRTSSFPSFQIRYLKNGRVSVTATSGRTISYDSEERLMNALGSMAATQCL